MGKLGIIGGNAIIRIYVNDHNPAHFHVIAPDWAAIVTIAPVAIYRGAMPSPVWKQVMAWAEDNKLLLVAEWNACNPQYPIK